MNLKDIMLNKKARYKKTNTVCFPLHKAPRAVKFMGTESRMVGIRGWGEGKRELRSDEYSLFFKIKKKFRKWINVCNNVNTRHSTKVYI